MPPGSNPGVPKKTSEEKIVDFDKVNQWRCLEESEQWLESILVLITKIIMIQQAILFCDVKLF